ncbi:MAG: Fe-S cluster assembly protein SufB [Mycoplasma sp.]|nr:Fe-S cluster assembly protein SufB [Candidatus Hennigella equi]
MKNKKYKYGFHDTIKNKFAFKRGLNEQVIKAISRSKNEPTWMLQKRLDAFKLFKKLKNPKWGPDLSHIDFDEYTYYVSNASKMTNDWKDVPQKIKDTFKKLKVTEAEAKFLSGVNNQYDSEVVYNKIQEELAKQKVIFCNIEKALQICPEIVKKYFGRLVPASDNKYAALNTAVWSGGSFIYIPKGVKLDKPLQAYFRINTRQMGQFERTLIVVEDKASLSYIEGCTAPIYDKNNLHAAVVEVFINKGATCRYTTIQNWSDNVLNLVTKRAICQENAIMEWVDGNIGSKLNMKYPATILAGSHARGKCISIALAHQGVIHDAGAKMIHLAPYTRSSILAKSIAHDGGRADYRGEVKILKNAHHCHAEVVCDTLLLDNKSVSRTIPLETIENKTSFIKHEAKVTQLDKEKMYYLNTKGLDDRQAKNMLSLGFLEPFTEQLPMEYAVELNRLLNEDFK